MDNGIMFVTGWIAAGNDASFRAAESAGMARLATIQGALRTPEGFIDGSWMIRYLQGGAWHPTRDRRDATDKRMERDR